MLSEKQLQAERENEQKINYISEQVIAKTAWGRFYGLMRMASKQGEGMIPHKICVDRDGRVLKIYKSTAGKWVGSFLKPAHEQMARDFSRGKYGRGMLDMIGFGSFIDAHEQMKAKCFIIRPNQILNINDRRGKKPLVKK